MDLTLESKELLTDNVWTFKFKSDRPLTWTPGQFIEVELLHDDPDAEGTKRWFTISSAPYDNDIQITTRLTSSSFKQALGRLDVGGKLKLIAAPDGDFVWQDADEPIVFVAGGIGITPFRSILRQRFRDHKPLRVTLVYASRTTAVPFQDEIAAWRAKDTNFKVEFVVGAPLTAAKLAKVVPGLGQSLIYVSGPEPLVESLGDQLREVGHPERLLKQDFFPNYDTSNY